MIAADIIFIHMITEDQWNLYLKKYKNLMWKIAHMISGDPTISGLDDNYGDIVLAALESIKGFTKKTGMNFEQMINTKYFDQYTKTCLWTAKARKGNGIKKNYPITNKKLSVESSGDSNDVSGSDTGIIYSDHLEDKNNMNPEIVLAYSEIFDSFSEEDYKLLKVISDNPDVISFNGRLKIKTLAKKSKLSTRKVEKLINNLRRKVNYDIET